MFASLHQQPHNFKPESMKLLREVEHIVTQSIPFCHTKLDPSNLGITGAESWEYILSISFRSLTPFTIWESTL
jgi:hypothetical protein